VITFGFCVSIGQEFILIYSYKYVVDFNLKPFIPKN